MNDQTSLRAEFVEGMSRAAFTVSIAATDGPAGLAGITVSAMTSVSADPPSVLVCVNRQSRFASKVQTNGCFTVSILTASQSEIAEMFAGRTELEDRFALGEWTRQASIAPLLQGSAVAFECSLIDAKPVGTHDVVIALVDSVVMGDPVAKPLIHHRRSYGTPAIPELPVHSP